MKHSLMDEIKRKTVKFPVLFSPIRLATTVLNFLWEPFTSGRSTDRKKSLIRFSGEDGLYFISVI